MGTTPRQVVMVKKALESGHFEIEALLFPGTSELDDGAFPSERVLSRKVKEQLDGLTLGEVHQRAAPHEIEVRNVEIAVVPSKRTTAWREPVQLGFQVLEWCQAEEAWVAYVPALGIEVVARDQEKLRARLPGHIQSALLRNGALKSLGSLVPLGRWREVSVSRTPLDWQPRSPKQVEQEDEESRDKKGNFLREHALLLEPASQPEAFEVGETVEQLAHGLADLDARSVLLVGASGCGKTAIFKECVRLGAALGLGQHKVWMTTGSRLVAGSSGFGMWQERCMAICKALRQEPSILHVGSLFELMQVGRSEHNKQGIASFLRPYLERRDIQAVAECTAEQLSLIESHEPRLVDAFVLVRVQEPDLATGRRILFRWADANGSRNQRTFAPEALDTADRLHRRFGGYSVYPGRPLRFLSNLLETPDLEGPITKAHVFNQFTRETGLPACLIDESMPMDLEQTRRWFGARLLSQATAVNRVVDVLATAKARMARPRKPIASLIFIGPTGVGKTQMAKCLAEYLFGDAHRMVRLDMSEFSDEGAVKRLVGDVGGAEGLLTSKVREQPFAIVLFDEFEKAHPLFYDLLLQVLGEGRLTDGAGRTADFTNSVVIMTSNLGAQSYSITPLGFVQDAVATKDAEEHFTQAVQKFVRPELFNRIDAVVPFAPLDAQAIVEVTRRELELIRRRDGVLARHMKLSVEEVALSWIAAHGFDEKYGARPLKRAVQEQLLVPLAEGVNSYDGSLLLQAVVSCAKDRLQVVVKPQTNAKGESIRMTTSDGASEAAALAYASVRRQISRLKKSSTYSEVTNLAYRLERFTERRRVNPHYRGEPPATRFQLSDVTSLLRETSDLETRVCVVEDQHLLRAYGHGQEPNVTMDSFQAEWSKLLSRYLDVTWPHPTGQICLGVYGRHTDLVCDVLFAYAEIAQAKGARIRCKALVPSAPVSSKDRPIRHMPIQQLDRLRDFDRLIGVVTEITGPMVHPYFTPEQGKQLVLDPSGKEKLLRSFVVDASAKNLEEYEPPTGVEAPKFGEDRSASRRYDPVQSQVGDNRLGRISWRTENFGGIIRKILDQLLEDTLQALLSE
jgi:ATP-dependent Clp protease ATP-binding subunit ClpC